MDGQALERVRGRSEEQPLQDLESDELGVLLSASGAGGRDPQAARRRGPHARRADDRGQGGPDGRGHVSGGEGGTKVPPRLLWLPAEASRPWMRSGCAGGGAGRYDWIIDLDVQKFFDTVPWDLDRQGGGSGHRHPLGAAVCEAVACCPAAAARTARLSSETREPRKGRRFRRSWRTCSCTSRSIRGWPGTIRTARSSATPTMPSCIARAGSRRKRCLPRSPSGWRGGPAASP